jgi:hypothetical protein
LFGVAGLPSYYQPVKAIARLALIGAAPAPWIPPSRTFRPHIFSKETGGPYFLAECLFIPLQQLIEAGYPPDKLHLIMLDRDPVKSLASWLNKLSVLVPEETLVQHYIITALNATRVENYAQRQGVPVTHYVYEASKEPIHSARALFDRLGLSNRFTDSVVTDWKEMGQLASEKAKIIYPNQPPIYSVPDLHSADTAYRYHDRDGAAVAEAYAGLLARFGIYDVYRASAQACVNDLGLDTATAAMLFDAATDEGSAQSAIARSLPTAADEVGRRAQAGTPISP